MWYDHGNNFPARGFSTPPAASWKSQNSFPAVPISERKSNPPPACRRDLFHVVHKVPAGDSPYGRAKHVQLIDKDPSKAIALFWAAINAGDRVDSALKDMAVVMKQLNRSEEAIEAIKSFRHLCSFESQESLDNVLVELYKRSGRIEEEIGMLHRKLNMLNEAIAFGGIRTKTARSQGKKVLITVEQERSRILGNLAWAYLQHHDYGLAENFYRKALALEPDNNKKCNLALCLMHINRTPEAKSLLQSVKASFGGKEMDESCAKSFERAVEMLAEIESKSKCISSNDWRKGPAESIGSTRKELQDSAVLYTQPKTASEGGKTRQRCDLTVHTLPSLDEEFDSKSESSNTRRERSWTDVVQKNNSTMIVEPISQPRMERPRNHMSGSKSDISDVSVSVQVKPKQCYSKSGSRKSWADMAEEERLQKGENLSPCLSAWSEEEPNNENLDSNMNHQSPTDYGTPSTNRSVRRSLCFDGNNKKRLQVFRDITP